MGAPLSYSGSFDGIKRAELCLACPHWKFFLLCLSHPMILALNASFLAFPLGESRMVYSPRFLLLQDAFTYKFFQFARFS